MLNSIKKIRINAKDILFQSRNIGSAVFNIDWISLTKSTRMSLIQIILRSNDPIKFTAGRLVPLSIDTFSAVRIIMKRFIISCICHYLHSMSRPKGQLIPFHSKLSSQAF